MIAATSSPHREAGERAGQYACRCGRTAHTGAAWPRGVAILIPVLHGLGIVTAVHAVMKTRTSQGAIAWAFALITVPYLALPLYWILGRDRFVGYVNARREEGERIGNLRASLAQSSLDVASGSRGPTSFPTRRFSRRCSLPSCAASRAHHAALEAGSRAPVAGLVFLPQGHPALGREDVPLPGGLPPPKDLAHLNFEITLLFADAGFAAEVKRMLEADFARCRPLLIAEFAGRSAPFKLAVQIARLMAPVL